MSGHRHPRRPGMTLIEILVVVAIVGVLMGLMLPAVQMVRETSHRTKCQNNLRQIGLALHAYHNSKGSFPPGYLCDTANLPYIEFNTPGWGWAAHLLPHLEQAPLAEQLRWKLPVEDSANNASRVQLVAAFTCPSDINTGVYDVLNETNHKVGAAATNSYVACYGFGGAIGEYPGDGNGVFYRNSRTRVADIRDGTSTTLAIGERAAWFCRSPWIGVMTSGTVRTSANSPTYVTAIEEAPVMVMARTTGDPLNFPYSSPYDFFTPHPSAGPFVFADGSVRALSFSLSAAIWEAIATRNGSEAVTSSDY